MRFHTHATLIAGCVLVPPASIPAQDTEVRDAAPGYREAIRQIRAALEIPDGEPFFPPEPLGEDTIGETARATLTTVAPALTSFRLATTRRACRFEQTGATPPFDEFEDLALELHGLATLVALDGRRAIEDGDPGAATADIRALFAHTHHCFRQTSGLGVAYGQATERTALELADRLLTPAAADPAVAKRVRMLLDAHARSRPSIAILEPATRTDVLRAVDSILDAAKTGDDEDSRLLRPVAREVRATVDSMLGEVMEHVDAAVAAADPKPLEAISELVIGWKETIPEDRSTLEQRDPAERARLLGQLLMLLVMPNVEVLGTEHFAIAAELERRVDDSR